MNFTPEMLKRILAAQIGEDTPTNAPDTDTRKPSRVTCGKGVIAA